MEHLYGLWARFLCQLPKQSLSRKGRNLYPNKQTRERKGNFRRWNRRCLVGPHVTVLPVGNLGGTEAVIGDLIRDCSVTCFFPLNIPLKSVQVVVMMQSFQFLPLLFFDICSLLQK
ncbi:uncharacterized protein LOC132276939 isoform X2 [Cornus florida]|uniref:uncharacterized protein LOC132276939 isoform X2 n=1 Tax=Cornus florida TaxID=4283 RepID=UPI00289DAED6|nr:uncharacterized protein LOC132276939 isoform X2 [Cornus florida]